MSPSAGLRKIMETVFGSSAEGIILEVFFLGPLGIPPQVFAR